MSKYSHGLKPRYYYHAKNILLFSSELRPLLSTNLIDRRISLSGLVEYLKYQTVHSPNTIVQNIKMLEAGTSIHYDRNHNLEKQSYWSPEPNRINTSTLDLQEIKDRILECITKSVNIRSYSDVQSGSFLSGGIDSSTLVALMSNNSSKKIKTYNVSFNEDEYDESRYARLVAERYSNDHTEIK